MCFTTNVLLSTFLISAFAAAQRQWLLPIPPGGGRKIVLIGDSILDNDFRMRNDPLNQYYLAYFGAQRSTAAEALRSSGFEVLNLAVYGSKLEHVEQQQLPNLQAQDRRYQLAVVSIGGNNLAAALLNPVRLVEELCVARNRMEAIIREISKKADHILLLTPPNVFRLGWFLDWFFDIADAGKIQTLNNMGHVTVINIRDVCPGDSLPDGVHPSAACYDMLYQTIATTAVTRTAVPQVPLRPALVQHAPGRPGFNVRMIPQRIRELLGNRDRCCI